MRIKKEKRKYSLFLLPMLCLLLFSGAMATGVTYSTYNSAASGSDSTTVAGFSVSPVWDTLQNDTVTMNCKSILAAGEASYDFAVTGSSGVTVDYEVVVELSRALPSGVTMTMERNGTSCALVKNGNAFTLADAVRIAAGTAQTDTYTIYFEEQTSNSVSAPAATLSGTSSWTPTSTSDKYDVTVRIIAEQVD